MNRQRRRLLQAFAATAALPLGSAFGSRPAFAATELRFGWQKGGSVAVIKARGELERALAARGVTTRWIEFAAGPQMVEALNVGSIDLGMVGETPPVIAQAAGANLVYVGHEPPAPRAETLLVPKDSPLQSVAGLKGRRVVLNKGSNVHYLLLRLLEEAGLAYRDVNLAFLPPADARAAFERGSVDAWVIWDPFASAAEAQAGARRLADARGVANNHNFYIASRPFSENNPAVLRLALEQIDLGSRWIGDNLKEAASIVAPQLGLTVEISERAFSHYAYGVHPLSEEVVRSQQRIADSFHALKLIPKALDVAAAVWRPLS